MSHSHDFYEIAYVYEGEGIHYIGEERISAVQGDLFFIPIGVTHCFQPRDLTGIQPLRILNCLYKAELVDLPSSQIPDSQSHFLFQATDYHLDKKWRAYHDHSGEIVRLFEILHTENKPSDFEPDNSLRRYKTFMQLIKLLNETKAWRTIPRLKKEDFPIHGVIQHMSNNCQNSMDLHAISQSIAVSPRHFQRLFKLQTGCTYVKMMQNIRIRNICLFLKYTNLTIQSIALLVGIQDMKYFYRLFAERVGITPGTYRSQYSDKNMPSEEDWELA
ncbi:AraC family transcriptional regulator [Paenibacillus polymyxa]|uniref:AraC family transcriptional regulator n=1 Tax=Paenibacillus polymyxa TaxID=1406 RepID=UPI002AB482CA|nr:AraC family transcriptional regulator [Paenibacillus polymyxa]MDY8023281.1 AraC family transcriptional regulator [Paenibacillus polymyxa]